MNTIMSVINGWAVASKHIVTRKRYPLTGEVIAEVQHSKSAMLDKALWLKLEIYTEVTTKYV